MARTDEREARLNSEEFHRIIGNPSSGSTRLPRLLMYRYLAGESLQELADDYDIPEEQVMWGIRIAYLRGDHEF